MEKDQVSEFAFQLHKWQAVLIKAREYMDELKAENRRLQWENDVFRAGECPDCARAACERHQ